MYLAAWLVKGLPQLPAGEHDLALLANQASRKFYETKATSSDVQSCKTGNEQRNFSMPKGPTEPSPEHNSLGAVKGKITCV